MSSSVEGYILEDLGLKARLKAVISGGFEGSGSYKTYSLIFDSSQSIGNTIRSG